MAAGIDIQWERKNGALVAAISLILAICLFVLAGVFADARPAFAQAQIKCPLPAGVTPPAGPRVTAKQVEDGSDTLMNFALAVRERSREHSQQATTVEQGQYIGCIIRQEGSPWRYGSTYIITLTPDGRVYIHAKDMALSGRLLNPLIYAEILSALGVSPTDLANLASPDPGTAGPALQAVSATLLQEPDGAFDATASIPGASGHAAVYVSPELGAAPIVLLAGFDLNESHLVSIDDETIDYGDPAVTARDVVDRETLKAFVTQAGEFFLKIISTGDVAAASKARIAFRDPNGPWRHGSVYIAVLQPATNLILFHGAFPDRFELRQAGISRDAVTGELIVDQLIARRIAARTVASGSTTSTIPPTIAIAPTSPRWATPACSPVNSRGRRNHDPHRLHHQFRILCEPSGHRGAGGGAGESGAGLVSEWGERTVGLGMRRRDGGDRDRDRAGGGPAVHGSVWHGAAGYAGYLWGHE